MGSTSGKSKKKGKSAQNLDITDGGPTVTAAIEFSIEYAKSARAKCRQCEEKIEKVHTIIFKKYSNILATVNTVKFLALRATRQEVF